MIVRVVSDILTFKVIELNQSLGTKTCVLKALELVLTFTFDLFVSNIIMWLYSRTQGALLVLFSGVSRLE